MTDDSNRDFSGAVNQSPGMNEREGLSDDQIMEILRRVTKDELYEMLTCKRWKDGIDITGPTFAAERLAKEFRAAAPAPSAWQPIEVEQHIAWLRQYLSGMTLDNWLDMKLRAELQLESLAALLPSSDRGGVG